MITSTAVKVWRKSSRSGNGDNCVEVGTAQEHEVAVRDTKSRSGDALSVTASEWAGWVFDIKNGSLDQ